MQTGPASNYCISKNPEFISNTDFHLAASSPCINAAMLTSMGALILNNDLDNNSRPLPAGTFPDMGCYEMQQVAVGIGENKNAALTIFPNPTNGLIHLSSLAESETTLQLYNSTGQLLKEVDVQNENSFDLSAFENGLYFMIIRQKNGTTYQKSIIKN